MDDHYFERVAERKTNLVLQVLFLNSSTQGMKILEWFAMLMAVRDAYLDCTGKIKKDLKASIKNPYIIQTETHGYRWHLQWHLVLLV